MKVVIQKHSLLKCVSVSWPTRVRHFVQSNHRCFEYDTSGCTVFLRSVAAVSFGETEAVRGVDIGFVLVVNSGVLRYVHWAGWVWVFSVSHFDSQHHSGKAGGRGHSVLTPLQGTKGLSLFLVS